VDGAAWIIRRRGGRRRRLEPETQPMVFPLRMSPTFVRLQNGFKGWVRSDFPAASIGAMLSQFDGRTPRDSGHWLKDHGKSRVLRQIFEDPAGKRWNLVIKCVRYKFFFRRLGFIFLASPALRALKGALLLQQHGIPTAPPLAALETRRWEGLGTSYFIAETVEHGTTLYRAWRQLGDTCPRTIAERKRRYLLAALAAFVRRVHDCGVYHRDMKGTNILVRHDEAGGIEFVLVDVDGVRRIRALSRRRREKNLIQICRFRGLSDRDRILFLREYCRGGGATGQTMKSLARRILPLIHSQRPGASRPGREKRGN
jgi:hypothetical protein